MALQKEKTNFTIKHRSYILFLIIFSVLLLNLFSFLLYSFFIKKTYDQSIFLSNQVENLTAIFRTEVQEWKNILIRSYKDKPMYEKYLAAFNEKSNDFRTVSLQIKYTLINFDDDDLQLVEYMENVVKTHEFLLIRYKNALTELDINNQSTYIEVDKKVRGMDRKMNDELLSLQNLIKQHTDNKIQSFFIYIGGFVIFLILAGLFIIYIYYKNYINYIMSTLEQLTSDLLSMIGSKIDFEKRINLTINDEFLVIGDAINKFLTHLSLFFYSNQDAVKKVSLIINDSSNSMLKHVNHQTASTEEVTAGLEEVASNLEHISHQTNAYIKRSRRNKY